MLKREKEILLFCLGVLLMKLLHFYLLNEETAIFRGSRTTLIKNMKVIFLLSVFIIAHFSYAVSPCQSLFDSLSKWKKPRDTLKFIDIPRTNEEQKLKIQGYGEQFYAGVDEMHYLIQLGNYLRENSIDPSRTHIENFVPLIARHYRHLQEGIQKYYGPTNLGPPHRTGLRMSKIQADLNYRILRRRLASYIGSAVFLWLTWGIRKVDQPLSLEAWQKLNLWWAVLMTPLLMRQDPDYEMFFNEEYTNQSIVGKHWVSRFLAKNIFFDKKELEEWIKEEFGEIFQQYSPIHPIPFPERVMLPTISSLGVFAMNQAAGGDQVIPIELSNRVQKQDRVLMDPLNIFNHDLYHVEKANYGQPLLGSPLLHHWLMSYFKELSPKKREQAEIIYFILIHELRNFTENSPSIEEITDKPSLLTILSSSFIAGQSSTIYNMSGELDKKVNYEWDENKSFFENERMHFNKLKEYADQEEQEYLNSLSPEIRAFLTQKDVVEETIDNPQLLEESAAVFTQAVQHILQNHPDII